ncbi:FDXHR family putative zinc-binding protein [Micromonospora aurantiaca (nom. illeg.)]|uniref:FDXHR family putative zinc-binding protein n=1 Tax=Micromonospora aurantiaca (nom. illeg.) TaxID=47850 RepID=UPI003F4CF28F
MTVRHSCSGCENLWTGVARAHCSSCHETFDTVKLFDMHRDRGKCKKPLSLQMEWDGAWRAGLLEP